MPPQRTFVDIPLLLITGALVVFGLVMLASASAPIGYDKFGDSYYYLKHQMVFGLIPGIFGLFFMSRVSYLFWKRHAMTLLFVSIALLVLVFIPGLSASIGTARSWVSIGGWFTFQPSEIAKLTFLIYLSAWLASRGEEGIKNVSSGFAAFALALGGMMALLAVQPDIGTMVILAGMAVIIYFSAGAPVAHIGGLLGGGMAALAVLISMAPYRAARFMTFLNPELDPQGIGYHINQALLAIGSGGLFGLGYGHSRQKFQYLPEVFGDSIFAVIAEEMGLFVASAMIVFFLAFLWRALHIAKRAPDAFGRYVALGIGSWIALQAFVNIGSMVAILPITGVPLPFVSYGGSSLAITMTAVGVLLNISKQRTE